MRGSLAKAQVIYAPVLEVGGEGRLLRACRILKQFHINEPIVDFHCRQVKMYRLPGLMLFLDFLY